jgi:ABC-2 type transport system permease protein
MKSNKSLFSATLFKSNIVRFLPFSILFTIIELINFPLVVFLNYSNLRSIDFESLLSLGAVSYGASCIFAILFALLTFGYLFSANKCNALHAFPIGRKSLFATNFLSAYVLLVAPQLIGFLISLPGIVMFSSAGAVKAFIPLHLAMMLMLPFIVLSIAVLSIMLSGNAFAGVIIYGIINFFYVAVVLIANSAVSFFGYGINASALMSGTNYYLSPVVDIFVRLSEYTVTELKNKEELVSIDPKVYIALAIYFAVAFAICLLAFLLYKRRELEVAGEMAAFEKELPFIRVIVSVIGAAVITMSLGSLFNAGKIGMLALYVVFSFLVYFATQMVLKKKFNIFSGKLIIRWVICCTVSIGAVLGLAAYETNYIPEVSKVDSASFDVSYNINTSNEKSTKKIQTLQKELINYSKAQKTTTGIRSEVMDYYYDEPFDDPFSDSQYYNIEITYKLKSGKEVERAYEYNGKDKKINALINEIEGESKYTNVFDRLDEIGVKYTIKGIEINSYTNDQLDLEYMASSGEYDKLIALLKEDVNKVTTNYRSLNENSTNCNADVWIECRIDNDNDKNALKKLEETSYSSSFVEGYISYDTYDDGNAGVFDIHIGVLPTDSKALEFAKEMHEKYK